MGVRCFAGISLNDTTVRELTRIRDAIRADAPDWRDEKWAPPQNHHITVQFFGTLTEHDLALLQSGIGEVVASTEPFILHAEKVRAVPNSRRCGMLWVQYLDEGHHFAELVAKIQQAASAFGILPDERTAVPHITLCRARHPKAIASDVPFLGSARTESSALMGSDRAGGGPMGDQALSVSVASVTVFTSVLSPRGPKYTEIGAWPLCGKADRAETG